MLASFKLAQLGAALTAGESRIDCLIEFGHYFLKYRRANWREVVFALIHQFLAVDTEQAIKVSELDPQGNLNLSPIFKKLA